MSTLVLYRKSEGGHSRTITQGWYEAPSLKDAYDFIALRGGSWESYKVFTADEVELAISITATKV